MSERKIILQAVAVVDAAVASARVAWSRSSSHGNSGIRSGGPCSPRCLAGPTCSMPRSITSTKSNRGWVEFQEPTK